MASITHSNDFTRRDLSQRFSDITSSSDTNWSRGLDFLRGLLEDLRGGSNSDAEKTAQVARLISKNGLNMAARYPELRAGLLAVGSELPPSSEKLTPEHRADLWYLSKEKDAHFQESPHGAYEVNGKRAFWSGGPGASAQTIYCAFRGLPLEGGRVYYPHDAGDFGRCLELLDRVPEWKARIGELEELSKEWRNLVAIWPELEKAYAEGKGDDLRQLISENTRNLLVPLAERRFKIVEGEKGPDQTVLLERASIEEVQQLLEQRGIAVTPARVFLEMIELPRKESGPWRVDPAHMPLGGTPEVSAIRVR